uniref:Uncharacterized protein n=1 Tax=Onchocerca volvulus TaxID=6282 RepID=A0A8R1TN72_ONCVO
MFCVGRLTNCSWMWSCTIYRHVLFIMAMLTRFVLLSQPSLSELNKVIAGIQKVKEKEGINDVCDETDGTGNWFVMNLKTVRKQINRLDNNLHCLASRRQIKN